LAVLLIGCTATPPSILSSSSPAGTASPTTKADAQSATQAEAARLLALVTVPPGSTKQQASSSSALGSPVMGTPASTSLILATQFWSVPLPLQAAWDWFGANPPAGLTQAGTARSSSQDGQEPIAWGYGYSAPSSDAWKGAGVDIGLAPIDANTTSVRVDGLALWLDPTPLSDDQPGSRMRATIAGGCPESDQGYVGVTNPPPALTTALLPSQPPTGGLVCRYDGLNGQTFAVTSQTTLDAASAAALAAEFGRLPLSHTNGDVANCPMDDGAVTLVVFAFDGRTDVGLWVKTSGCQTVANGFIVTANDGTVVP